MGVMHLKVGGADKQKNSENKNAVEQQTSPEETVVMRFLNDD